MDYYTRKQNAMKLIKACKKEGLDFEETYFQVLENYALGKKFVKEYYERLNSERRKNGKK